MANFRYDVCKYNGKSPNLLNALTLKDTFGCLPGFKLFRVLYFLEFSKGFGTMPLCTANGWAMKAGGPLVDGIITDIWCT